MMFKRVYKLLLREEQNRSLGVALTVLLNSLFDFAGLAALLPLVFKLIDGNATTSNALMLCGGVLVFVIIKCAATMWLTYYQNRFLLNLYKRISHTLYSNFFKRGLLFVKETGSVKLAQDINYNCFSFAQNMLAPMLRVAADAILALLVSCVLLVYQPMIVALLYLVFIPFVIFYFLGIKSKIKQIGANQIVAMKEQSRVVLESFKGYAEVEVNGGFPVMEKRFLHGAETIAESHLKLLTIMRLPAVLSEIAIVIGLGLLIAIKSEAAIEVFTIFAVSSFRLLPALRNIVSGVAQINNSVPCLEIIESGVRQSSENSLVDTCPIVTFEGTIQFRGLSYSFPYGRKVINDLNFTINKGDYIGIKGVSGAGKSTLFNLILGLLQPTNGAILIDGVELNSGNKELWLKRVGYVAQDVFMVDDTLLNNVALGAAGVVDREKIIDSLNRADLGEWIATLPNGVDTPMRECGAVISGGQKQRIGIARALYKGADVLLFDEATSALDNIAEERINKTIDELRKELKGITILSIAHRDSSLSYCDRILELDRC